MSTVREIQDWCKYLDQTWREGGHFVWNLKSDIKNDRYSAVITSTKSIFSYKHTFRGRIKKLDLYILFIHDHLQKDFCYAYKNSSDIRPSNQKDNVATGCICHISKEGLLTYDVHNRFVQKEGFQFHWNLKFSRTRVSVIVFFFVTYTRCNNYLSEVNQV